MRTQAALLFLMTSIASTPALADTPKIPEGEALVEIAQTVGLSPDQLAKVKKLSRAAQRELITLQAKLRLAQLDLQEAVEADPPTAEGKILPLVERVGNLETEIKKNHVLTLLRVRNTLDKAQWEKLQALHAAGTQKPLPAPPPPPARIPPR